MSANGSRIVNWEFAWYWDREDDAESPRLLTLKCPSIQVRKASMTLKLVSTSGSTVIPRIRPLLTNAWLVNILSLHWHQYLEGLLIRSWCSLMTSIFLTSIWDFTEVVKCKYNFGLRPSRRTGDSMNRVNYRSFIIEGYNDANETSFNDMFEIKTINLRSRPLSYMCHSWKYK